MKKYEERVLQQIKAWEDLRPRVKVMLGHDPYNYAYSRKMAFVRKLGYMLIAVAILIFAYLCVFHADWELKIYPGSAYIGTCIFCFFVGYAICSFATLGRRNYVLANRKTARELERTVTEYRAKVEVFEQSRSEAEIYRPKFDRLRSIIEQELRGTYKPHWWPERQFKVEISFGSYTAEWYNLTENDYAKLLSRLVETRCIRGSKAELTEFIQKCENSLKL